MSRRSHALSASDRARIEDVDRLVAVGPRGVRELIGLLSESSWTVRRAVVAGLASLGDAAVQPVCAWLRDVRSSEHAIAAAVDTLAASIGTTVNDQVLALTGADNRAVIADAAMILGRRRDIAATARLATLVEHDDDNVAVAAIEALGAIGGTAAVDTLVRVVDSRRFFRSFPAIQVLARTGDPRAVQPLAMLLADDTYRLEVVRALGRTGSAVAIGPITSLLHNPSDAILRVVAIALSELIDRADWMGTSDHAASVLRTTLAPWLGRLANALRSGDPTERAAIARLLGRAGDASVLPAITEMLDDAAMTEAATDALQHLERVSDDALITALGTDDAGKRAAILPLVRSLGAAPAVRALLGDEDVEVRARACEALARISDTRSVPALFDMLGDTSPRVAHAAVSAILTLGTDETEPLALAAARSNRPPVRRHAMRILGAFGYASAFQTLRDAITDSDRRIAELAIAGIGSIEDARVDSVLGELADSRDDAIRAAVMRAAAHRGGEAGAKLLARGLTDSADWVRYYAAQGFGRIGTADAPQSSALLVERLRDAAPQVRIAAIESLSRLGSAEAWDAVCRAAASSDPDERRAGLVGVGMQAGTRATAILLDAASSTEQATRLVALAGLARQGTEDALSALGRAISDPSPEVQSAALSLLADRDDEGAATVLVESALHSEPEHPVQRALSRPGTGRVVAILSRLETADVRGAPVLVAALARMGLDRSAAALFETLAMTNPAARAAAASSIVSLGVDGAVRAVSALAIDDPDAEVRRVCAATLASV